MRIDPLRPAATPVPAARLAILLACLAWILGAVWRLQHLPAIAPAAGGDGIAPSPWSAPGPAAWLALAGGGAPWIAAALSLAVPWSALALARRWFGPAAGWLALALAAAHLPLAHAQGQAWIEQPHIALVAGGLWAALCGGTAGAIAGGALLGLAGAWGPLGPALAIACTAAAIVRRHRRLAWTGPVALVAVLVLSGLHGRAVWGPLPLRMVAAAKPLAAVVEARPSGAAVAAPWTIHNASGVRDAVEMAPDDWAAGLRAAWRVQTGGVHAWTDAIGAAPFAVDRIADLFLARRGPPREGDFVCQRLALLGLALPALLLLWMRRPRSGARDAAAADDAFPWAPVAAAAVAVAVLAVLVRGEPLWRLPIDPLLIVLAAGAYARAWPQPVIAGGAAADAEPPSATAGGPPLLAPAVRDPAPPWLWRAAALIWCGGAIFRVVFVAVLHPPTAYLFSDPANHTAMAVRFATGASLDLGDTIYAPGFAMWQSLWYRLDPSWALATWVQAGVSAATPLLIALLARRLLGGRIAAIALILASLSFPIVDYAGYFMSEALFAALIVLAAYALVRALMAGADPVPPGASALLARAGWGLAAGACFGAAALTRGQALMFLLATGTVIVALGWRRWRTLAPIALAGACGLAAVVGPSAARSTRLNEGRFTLISSNPGNVLLQGYHGDQGVVSYLDRGRGRTYIFAAPPMIQLRRDRRLEVPFGPYDSDRCRAAAMAWIRAHPDQAAVRAACHAATTIVGTVPWPPSHQRTSRWMLLAEHLFLVAVLLPAGALAIVLGRRAWRERGRFAAFWLLALPYAAIIGAAAITIGDPRYRIPFDGFLIILAAWWYGSRRAGADRLRGP